MKSKTKTRTPQPTGPALKTWCEKRGLNRRVVAAIIGCDPRTVTRLWAAKGRALTAVEWDALRAEVAR